MFKHEFIEIGGVKWATMNIGASSVTDYGLYFQWGDIKGYTQKQVNDGDKPFGWGDYKFLHSVNNGVNGPNYGFTKYNITDGLKVLEPFDDAAHMAWLGGWRMPTAEEFQSLGNATTSVWTSDYQGSGVKGLVCTDKTDSSKVLFFPACGYCALGGMYAVGYFGCYWSSSLGSVGVAQYARNLRCLSGCVNWNVNCNRCCGFPVRAVLADI